MLETARTGHGSSHLPKVEAALAVSIQIVRVPTGMVGVVLRVIE
jgi:hypothetical protein